MNLIYIYPNLKIRPNQTSLSNNPSLRWVLFFRIHPKIILSITTIHPYENKIVYHSIFYYH